jgi:hypothetical protein
MPRAAKNTVKLEKSVDEKLKSFKKIFDAVIEEDISFNDYANTVISVGLDSMLRTMVPSGHEWFTLQTAFDNRYETMCDIIAEIWLKDLKSEEEGKKQIRRAIEDYIR